MLTAIGLVVSMLAAQADPAEATLPPPPPEPTAYKCEAADGTSAWQQKPCTPAQKSVKAIPIPADASEAKGTAPRLAPPQPLPTPPENEAPPLELAPPKVEPEMVYVPAYDMWVPDNTKACEQLDKQAEDRRGQETGNETYERNKRRQELGC